MIRLENIRIALAGIPDMLLLLTEELAVVDNLSGKISLIVHADPREEGAYGRAIARLDELRRLVRTPVKIPGETGAAGSVATGEFG